MKWQKREYCLSSNLGEYHFLGSLFFLSKFLMKRKQKIKTF